MQSNYSMPQPELIARKPTGVSIDQYLTSQLENIEEKIEKDGAANTAWHIGDCLRIAKPLKGPFRWSPVDRGELHRSKFTATQEEISEHLKRLGFSGDIKQVDDSTFLIWKQTAKAT